VIAAGIAAGCAIGTKYNAAPIAVLPLVAVVVARGAGVGAVVAAVLTPCLAFLATTPFLLANLPLFLDHLGYEIWHYGIAGHEGHTGEPGLGQALFYANWFWGQALGIGVSICAALGALLLALRGDRRAVIVLLFPALYLALMISQKANFPRNMHLMIPYLACFAAVAAGIICQQFGRLRGVATFIATAGLCVQPMLWSLSARSASQDIPESRITAAQWLRDNPAGVQKTAVSGTLQFEPGVYGIPGLVRLDLSKETLESLRTQGFERIVTSAAEFATAEEQEMLTPEFTAPGEQTAQRIVKNPEVRVYRLK
jgi:hypothetical protein